MLTALLQSVYNRCMSHKTRVEVLCKLQPDSPTLPEVPATDLCNLGALDAKSRDVRRERKHQICPISNIPEAVQDSVPSPTQLKIWLLEQDVVRLRVDRMTLLTKLTRCLEALQSEQRFFEVGLHYNEWETYGELEQRLNRIKAVISLINDPVAGINDEIVEKAKLEHDAQTSGRAKRSSERRG